MGSLELHVGPHGLKVVVGEDDDGPPAVVDTLEDLVWDGGAGSPVPAVNETFVALGFGLLRPLQPAEQNVFHVLGVLVGVREKHVILLPVVRDGPSCSICTVQYKFSSQQLINGQQIQGKPGR